jgi:hypothetical protein
MIKVEKCVRKGAVKISYRRNIKITPEESRSFIEFRVRLLSQIAAGIMIDVF